MARVLIACLAVALTAVAQVTSLPPRIESPSYGGPGDGNVPYIWVAGSELFDDEGRLKVDDPGFSERFWLEPGLLVLRRGYEGQLRDGTEGCFGGDQFINYRGYPYERAEVDALMRAVSSLVVGRVVATQTGFVRGDPGVMLEIALDPLRSRGELLAEEGAIYVHYPAANVPVGNVAVCLKRRWRAGDGDEDWPASPAVGDRVAFFPHSRQEAAHPDFPIYRLDYRGYELAFEHNGRLRTPYVLRERFPTISGAESFDVAWSILSEAFDRVHAR